MSKRFPYHDDDAIRRSGLCNLRYPDVKKGGEIKAGEITYGAHGFAAAELTVIGWTVKTVPFRPSRRCLWQGFELPCMVLSQIPPGKSSHKQLRHCNYIVARVINEEVASEARKLDLLYVITSKGIPVITLEISRFERQKPARRATLLL